MEIDDTRLMAYVDGELSAEEAARIESQAAADAALAERIRRTRALRVRLGGAYAPVLDEEVPQRLRDVLRPGSEIPDPVRAIPAPATALGVQPGRRRRRARDWSALAASLLLGVLIARVLPPGTSPAQDDAFVDAAMRAGGALERALNDGLAAAGPDGGVSIGLSFRARDGVYCRSFTLDGEQPRAGLACREGGARWRVTTLSDTGAATGQEMRQAASGLPPAVLADIDARIEGEPLDASQEQAARAARWR